MQPERINLSESGGGNIDPILSFLRLQFCTALTAGAGKMSCRLQKDTRGLEGFQITLSGSKKGNEYSTYGPYVFLPWVDLIKSHLRDVREREGVIKGILETRNPNSLWDVHYAVKAQQMDFKRRYDPTPPVTLAERLSDLRGLVFGFWWRFYWWLRSPKKMKLGRIVVTDKVAAEDPVLFLFSVTICGAVMDDVEKMTFELGNDENGKAEWKLQMLERKGEQEWLSPQTSLFTPAIESLLGKVLEQVSERDGVTQGILLTYQPNSKWNVRYTAAAHEVLFERVREVQSAGK